MNVQWTLIMIRYRKLTISRALSFRMISISFIWIKSIPSPSITRHLTQPRDLKWKKNWTRHVGSRNCVVCWKIVIYFLLDIWLFLNRQILSLDPFCRGKFLPNICSNFCRLDLMYDRGNQTYGQIVSYLKRFYSLSFIIIYTFVHHKYLIN